ncbi:lipopolysaccharide assembly protein LapA domain-containing protein [Rubritalea tangerina]|uniref:Lipopolysaccharide assembly protein LapA domain-containing protein n=1 Tax=Rubritalea tangerina TaxID=430798 RepID=A0ABW4ZG07_9BACT
MTTSKKIRLGITLALVALVIVVILQNTEQVTTTVLFATIKMPLAFLLFLTFLIGALGGFFLAYLRINKRITKVQKSIEHR